MRERLDFFKLLSPPDSREHRYSARPACGAVSCDRFLKPVAGLILPLAFLNCKWHNAAIVSVLALPRRKPLTQVVYRKQHS
jgi:hypothetical protein